MYKSNIPARIGTFLLSATVLTNIHAACHTDSCRPASIADVKSLINQRLAPQPGNVPEYNPVQITATRACNLTPDKTQGNTSFTLYEDNISITSQITKAADTSTYTLSCANPTSANITLYNSRNGVSTISSDVIIYNTAGTLSNPTQTLNTEVLTTLLAPQTTSNYGFAAGLNNTFVACKLVNVEQSITWNVLIPVPYCS